MKKIVDIKRSDLLKNGALVSVSEDAKTAGITVPTALTRAVHDRYVKVPEGEEYQIQSESGRLWDLLYMFTMAVRSSPETTTTFEYEFFCNNPGETQSNEEMTQDGRKVTLKELSLLMTMTRQSSQSCCRTKTR